MEEPAAVFFVPAPDRVITEMLRLAEVGSGDLVYDLGCGDGRILVAAAQQRGAAGVGIDIDPKLIARARDISRAAGVQDLVRFEEGDLFQADFSRASVIVLYLLDSLNIQLRPRLLSSCAPGTRIVSYSFGMGDWEPDAHTAIAANGVSLWVIPARLEGRWRIRQGPPDLKEGQLRLEQRYQHVFGSIEAPGSSGASFSGYVSGEEVALNVITPDEEIVSYTGRIEGEFLVLTSDNGGSLIADREIGN